MLDLLGIGVLAFGVGLSGALSPGPLTVLTIREAARRGWWAGPLATFGHGVVELALIVALALGLAAYVEDGAATAVIAFAGGAILIWMGAGLARSAPRATLGVALAPVGAGEGPVRTRLPGVSAVLAVAPAAALVSIVNPYWVIWWATVGTKLTVDSLDAGWAGPGAVFVGHILSDLAWLTFVAALVGGGRRRMGASWYRWLLGACAAFLIAIGAWFIVSGVRFLT